MKHKINKRPNKINKWVNKITKCLNKQLKKIRLKKTNSQGRKKTEQLAKSKLFFFLITAVLATTS